MTAPHHYGCWNHAPHAEGYWANSRVYDKEGKFKIEQVFIVHNLSRQCKYDLSQTDPNCTDCKHREDYHS